MAKKKSFELDEFGFEKDSSLDFDIPEFDFGGEIKDDRKPATVLKDSFIAGVKSRAKDGDFYRHMVKKTLPKGYGSAMDMADEIGGTLKNLYDEAGKELKPALRDLKRVTDRLTPQLESVLPKTMMDKIKKWSQKKDETSFSTMADNAREADISGQLGDIFQTNIEADNKRNADSQAKELMRDIFDNRRHTDSMGQLNSIRVTMQQMANYQARVVTAFQRKSLELQFRHYFVAVDALEESRKQGAILQARLKEIEHNTGLPDFVKLRDSERIKEMFRDSLLEGVGGGLLGNRRDFAQRFTQRFVKNAKNQIGNAVGSFRDGLSGVESILDAQQLRKELGDNNSMFAEIAGGTALDAAMGRAGKWVRGKLEKNDKIAKVGNMADYVSENRAQLLEEWARSGKGENGMFGGLLRLIKDPMAGMLGTKNGLVADDPSMLHQSDMFSRLTNKSITEVIPGLLARIHRELVVTRTGDEKAKLISYDFTSNRFSDRDQVKKSLLDSIVSDTEARFTTDEVDRMVASLEKDSGQELTPEQRKALGRQLMMDNLNNKVGRASDYTNASRYQGAAAEHADVFTELFKKKFENDPTFKKQGQFAREYNKLGQYISNPVNAIQRHVNTGKSEELREMGLIKEDGKSINMDKLRGMYYKDQEPAIPGFAKGGTHKGGVRMVGEQGPELEATGPSRIFNHKDTVEMLKEAGMATNEAIIAAIKEANAKYATEAVFDTLLRIEAKLYEGIDIKEGATIIGRGKGPWANMNLRGRLKKAFGRGVDTMQFFRQQVQKRIDQAKPLAKSVLGLAGNTAMGLGNLAMGFGKKLWKGAKDKHARIADIWVQGELGPRLLAAKLEAGEYFDKATGKVIKTYKDIKGDVVDAQGRIWLRAKEIRKSYVKDGMREKALGLLTSVKDTVKKGVDGALGMIPPALRTAGRLARWAWDKALNNAQDVYVKGKMHLGPRLFGVAMENGEYYSQLTGKVIRHPGQIDGPVINARKQIQLSRKDIAAGLVDVDGKPLKSGLAKLIGTAQDMMDAGKDFVVKRISQLKDLASGAWKRVKGAFGHVDAKTREALAGTAQGMMLVRLTEIRDILNSRLPERKRKIAGDVNGDGVREGSAEDLAAKAKAKATGGIKGFFGKMPDTLDGKLAALVDLTKKSLKVQEKTAENTEKSLMDRAGDLMGMGGGKLKTLGKTAMKFGGKALGIAGAAYGAYSAYDNFKQGNYGEAALDAGLAVGSGALGVGGLSALGATGTAVGSGLMAGAGMAGTALAALLASPVALTALGVAAAGAGAYFGYKWLKKKFSKPGPLFRLRMAQYGFNADSSDKVDKIRALEEELWAALRFGQGGAQLDGKKIDVKKLFEIFDLTPPDKKGSLDSLSGKDQKAAQAFLQWFAMRFKPVFLNHASTIHTLAPELTLADPDGEMKPQVKDAYFDAIKADNPAYRFMGSPFPDAPGADFGPEGVKKVVEAVQTEIDELVKKPGDATKPPTDIESDAGGLKTAALPSAVAATMAKPGPEQKAAGAKPESFLGQAGKAITDFGKGLAEGLQPLGALMVKTNPFLFAVSGLLTTPIIPKKLSALTAIRLKAYGLRDFTDNSRVQALLSVESFILSNPQSLKKTESGIIWNGSIEEVLKNCASAFGLKPENAAHGRNWYSWFFKRFMPVFVGYLGVVSNLSGSDFTQADSQAERLSAQQQLDVVNVLTSSKAWYVSESPWQDYELNTDPGSVEGHEHFIRQQVKTTPLNAEQAAKSARDKPQPGSLGDGKSQAGQAAADPAKAQQNGIWSNIGNKVSEMWNSAKNALGEAGMAVGKAVSNAGSAVVGAAKDFGKGVADAFSGGSQVNHPGGGTGGDINAIPQPKGKGSWDSVKDTILAASKMVGVDPKLMATMAAIESGFDWAVKAGTSSATGLYQFISSTWKTMLKKYGSKYGIDPNTPPTDPRANALMGAEFLRENAEAIKGAVGGRALTDTDLYLAHFLGAGGAKKLLSASPEANAVQMMPDAARANKPIFYNPDGSARTVAEVYAEINRRVRKKSVNVGDDKAASTPGQEKKEDLSNQTIVKPAFGGNIPVADQAAGPVTKSTGTGAVTSAAAAATPASAPTAAPAVDPMSANLGFSPRARDLTAQAQYQKEVTPAAAGVSDQTVQQLIGVGRDQLTVLMTIRDLMQNGGLKVSLAGMPEQPSAPTPTEPPKAARPMTEPPLSMRKKVNV